MKKMIFFIVPFLALTYNSFAIHKMYQSSEQDLCQKFAKILGGAVLPAQLTNKVCTVAKPRNVPISVDGIPTKSPLVNTALFSFEKGPQGNWLNLGETAGLDQEISKLRDGLTKQNIKITAIHTHWLGTDVAHKPTTLIYMHWEDSQKDPLTFASDTAQAWKASLK